jgi:hypothetical protein
MGIRLRLYGRDAWVKEDLCMALGSVQLQICTTVVSNS